MPHQKLNHARWKHFKVICKHRRVVREWCFKLGIPWQGLIHDLSKFSPTEFNASAQYFQGRSSPIDAEKREKGYSIAWQHHKGRNPHHWEYWIDRLSTKENYAIEMPVKYVYEMLADFIGAGQAYNPTGWTCESPLKYYMLNRSKYLLHPNTEKLFYGLLQDLADLGEKKFLKHFKQYKKALAK